MRWTSERPTVPGYYWVDFDWLADGSPDLVELSQDEFGILEVASPGIGDAHPLYEFECARWCGPLEPPPLEDGQ